ncbi:hypothetical protein JCM11251_004666 [Rhodosporidiobolus azoricus]
MTDDILDRSAEASPPPVTSLELSPPAPSDPILVHYLHLFESLLRNLGDLQLQLPTDESATVTNGVDEQEGDWRSLRNKLRDEHASPVAWARRVANEDELKAQAGAVAGCLVKLGATRLAEGCLAEGREEANATGWTGLVEAMSWLEAVKDVLEGQAGKLAIEPPPVSFSNDVYPTPHATSDHSPMLAAAPPPADLSFSFSSSAHPSSSSTAVDPASLFISPGILSAPPPSQSQTSLAPSELLAQRFAPAPVHEQKLKASAPTSSPFLPSPSTGSNVSASNGKAAAFAERMSGLSSATAPAYENITYTSTADRASSSTSSVHPTSNVTAPSPSTAFAPPPAAGQIPKPKKSRASAGGARRTSEGVVKGKGLSEVYHPPPAKTGESSRPQRKRKLPKSLTFEVSSDVEEEEARPAAKRAKGAGKGKGRASLPAPGEDEEIDELASDYEDQVAAREARRSLSVSVKEEQEEEPEEEDATRFKVGTAVMAKFPNYNFFPSAILDPRSAPPSTQGKRVKGAYLVKSIPSGADHRWIPPEESHIRAITPHELAQIDSNKYDKPPPTSWVKWRPELLEAARLVRDSAGLADWLSRPTDLEFAIAAEAERKKAAKATAGW